MSDRNTKIRKGQLGDASVEPIDLEATGGAETGQVPSLGGDGQFLWVDLAGGGDMLKSVYDKTDAGIVDKAQEVDDGSSGDIHKSTAIEVRDAVDKKHAPNSDDQTADTVPTDETGVSVQDALDTLETDKSNKSLTINTQTDDYTLVLTDVDKVIDMDVESGSGILTVPTNETVAFPIGTTIAIRQAGSIEITITPQSEESGDDPVTINNQNGLVTTGQHAMASLLKVDTNTWVACGALGV